MLNQCISFMENTLTSKSSPKQGEKEKKAPFNIFDIYLMQSEVKVAATLQTKEKLKL